MPGEASNLFYAIGQTNDANQSLWQSVNGGANWRAISGVGTVLAFGYGAPQSAGNYPSVFIVGWLSSGCSGGGSGCNVTVGTPNCSPNYCWTVRTGLPWVSGAPIQAWASGTQEILGTLVSYNSATGAAVVTPTSAPGSGTSTTWTIYDYGLWRSDNCSASGGCTSWNNIGTWPNGSMDNIRTITGDPSIWNCAYIGFGGSGYMQYNYLLKRDLDPAANDSWPVGLVKVGLGSPAAHHSNRAARFVRFRRLAVRELGFHVRMKA